jgi:hypothetical protein
MIEYNKDIINYYYMIKSYYNINNNFYQINNEIDINFSINIQKYSNDKKYITPGLFIDKNFLEKDTIENNIVIELIDCDDNFIIVKDLIQDKNLKKNIDFNIECLNLMNMIIIYIYSINKNIILKGGALLNYNFINNYNKYILKNLNNNNISYIINSLCDYLFIFDKNIFYKFKC